MPKPTGQLRQITTKCSLSDGHGILKAGNTPGQLSVVRCIEGHREVWPRTMPRGNEVISAQQRHWGKTNSCAKSATSAAMTWADSGDVVSSSHHAAW